MAKDKTKTGVPNRHLHARISFLQQASTYLTLQTQQSRQSEKQSIPRNEDDHASREMPPAHKERMSTTETEQISKAEQGRPGTNEVSRTTFIQPPWGGLPSLLFTHLTQVARKSQIRLHPNIKHRICKRCNAILAEGTTSRKYVENLSKGGKKPHADVLVVECGVCGAVKRWPVGAKRQKGRKGREDDDNIGDKTPTEAMNGLGKNAFQSTSGE